MECRLTYHETVRHASAPLILELNEHRVYFLLHIKLLFHYSDSNTSTSTYATHFRDCTRCALAEVHV